MFLRISFSMVNRALCAILTLFLGSFSTSYGQYEFVPASPQWHPTEILNWNPETDPNAPFGRSSVPLAARFTAPTADVNPALSAAWNVNPHARPGEGKVQAVTTFNTIPVGSANGWRTTRLYAPTIWQYSDSLVFWGSSDRDTKTILAPTAHVIDAAHRNGVRVYGKIFYNWNASADNAALQRVRDLLVKSGNTFPVADKLVQAAVYYGFDGWFINQENYQTNSTDAQNMRDFLVYFRQKAAASGASHLRITWYDAMSDNGSRSFQNALTTSNDGYLKTPANALAAHEMFMNFWWYNSSTNISKSRTLALSLGLNPYDLYAGIWTENNRTYGSTPDPNGGGNIAVTWDYLFPEGQPHHTSVALFGSETPFFKGKTPAGTATQDQLYWSGPNSDPSNTAATTALPNWRGLAHYIPANSPITTLPFITHFNAGQGHLYKIGGNTLMTGPWTNLSLQDILPTWRWLVTGSGTKITPSLDFTESYYGGSSLKITGKLAANVTQEVKLYQTRLPVSSNTNFRIIYKPSAASAAQIRIGYAFEDAPGTMYYTTAATASAANWSTANFSLAAHAGKALALITLQFTSPGAIDNYAVNIGRLEVSNGSAIVPSAPTNLSVEGIASNPDEAMATRLKLKWTASPGSIRYYNVYYCQNSAPVSQRVWLGATPNTNFFVQEVRRIGSENQGYIQIEAVSESHGTSSSISTVQPFAFQPLPNLHRPVIPAYPVANPLTVIGSKAGSSLANAFDNNLTTYSEPGGADGAWVGLDLGVGNAKRIVAIRYAPRAGWVSRILNGVFQGSNTADFSSGVVELAKIVAPPPEGVETTLLVTNANAFRYLRYLSPGGGYANIAEMKFYAAGSPILPAAPQSLQATVAGSSASLIWVAPASGIAYGYNVFRSNKEEGPYTTIAANVGTTTYVDTGLTAGMSYYYTISAVNEAGGGSGSAPLLLNPPTSQKTSGTVLGFGAAVSPNIHARAFDNSLGTYFESSEVSSGVGLDLGSGSMKKLKSIRYSPKNNITGNLTNANLMIGGRFQVATMPNFSDAMTLFTIASPPAYNALTSISFIPPSVAYRYIRFTAASGQKANIAEFEIYAEAPDPYEAWLVETGIPSGAARASFDADYDQDGIENGVEYMVPGGMTAVVSSSLSGISAVIREDSTVTTTLWTSQNLGAWSLVTYNVSPDQTGVAQGFVRITAQFPVVSETQGEFYRLRFSR